MEQKQELKQAEEAVHTQAEFPAAGTSLNPVEETWEMFADDTSLADQYSGE